MDVRVRVDGQRMILRDGSYCYAPGSQEFIKFIFELSSEWDGLRIFAQFAQGQNAYNSYLDSNNCAYMPRDVQSGQCLMMLYGTEPGGSIIGTSLPMKLNIVDTGYVEDASSTGITRTLYMQLIDDLQAQYADFTDDIQEQQDSFTSTIQSQQTSFINETQSQQNSFTSSIQSQQNTFTSTMQSQYNTFTSAVDTRITAAEGQIATKADANHNHDSRYYTESEMNTKLSTKLNTSDVATLAEVKSALGIT